VNTTSDNEIIVISHAAGRTLSGSSTYDNNGKDVPRSVTFQRQENRLASGAGIAIISWLWSSGDPTDAHSTVETFNPQGC
jgi:hypothetical protein